MCFVKVTSTFVLCVYVLEIQEAQLSLEKPTILFMSEAYYYLRQGGNVFARLCLFVCVSAR